MSDDLFNDPELARLINAILKRKGVRHLQDREDLTADVLERLLIWRRKNEIVSAEELKAGARVIVRNTVAQHWRDRRIDAKHNAGLTDEADESTRPPSPSAIDDVDAKRTLEEIRRYLDASKSGDKTAALLAALVEGTTLAEYANETGQTPAAVRKAAEREQRRLEKHFFGLGKSDFGLPKFSSRAAGLAAAVACILFVLFVTPHIAHFEGGSLAWGPKPRPETFTPHLPDDDNPALPPPPTELPEEALARTAEARANALDKVRRAEIAFKREEWHRCVELLAWAKELDKSAGAAPELEEECKRHDNDDSNAKVPLRPQRRR